MPRILAVVGARPNYVKTAPVLDGLAKLGTGPIRVVHTGQHYDENLASRFIDLLGMRVPDVNLEVGSGSHAQQTGQVMIGVEREIQEWRPDVAVVAGDVNSTMAAALAAAKCRVPLAHIESGLRSRDLSMPEEVNRVVTDRVSDLLLCHCEDAVANLAAEGVAGGSAPMVGNTMIDSLLRVRESADEAAVQAEYGVEAGSHCLVTLHRPALVDDPALLGGALDALGRVAEELPTLLPLHPRTRARIDGAGLSIPAPLRAIEPLAYPDFVALMGSARVVVTDSGGIQEETSALGVPCLTYRPSTERPVTVELGTNTLVGRDPERLVAAVRDEIATPGPRAAPRIPLWDGAAGPRAAAAILERFG
jgi:UDP-N-acetylglucosamine 2-epimerase (non-hydrolysing)